MTFGSMFITDAVRELLPALGELSDAERAEFTEQIKLTVEMYDRQQEEGDDFLLRG
jgi:hypothetical protein